MHAVREIRTTNFWVTPLMPKSKGDHHYYRKHVTSRSQISLNREMRYERVTLVPKLYTLNPNDSQLVLRCHAECRSCSGAISTTSAQSCRPAAFDLEPVPDPKSDRPFELKLRQDKSNGPLIADVTFLIRYGDQEWCCPAESLM